MDDPKNAQDVTTGDESVSTLTKMLQEEQKTNRMLMEQILLSRTIGSNSVGIPPFRTFDINKENFESYVGQLERHFDAYLVKDPKQQKNYFLSWVGTDAYELISKMETRFNEEHITFECLKKVLTDHFQNKVHIVASRYKFQQCRLKDGQSHKDWIAEARGLAKRCDFFSNRITSEKQAVDDRLRDLLVAFTPVKDIRRSALLLDNPSLDQVLAIADNFEMLERVSSEMSCKQDSECTDEAIQLVRRKLTTDKGNNWKKRCERCGGRQHLKEEDCWAKSLRCHFCKKIGHIQRCCKMRKSGDKYHKHYNIHEVDNDEDILASIDSDDTVYIGSLGQNKSPSITININGGPVSMDFDTGAAVSIISKQLWEGKGKPKLFQGPELKLYDGSRLEHMGLCYLNLELGGIKKEGEAIVIEGARKPLFGRPWIRLFNMSWPAEVSLHQVENSGEGSMKQILGRFPSVFEDKPGEINDYEARIYVREDAVPRCLPNRRVPYALKDKVVRELERMEKEKLIEKVDVTKDSIEWSTPLVLVRKANGEIRLCADFKATLNPSLTLDTYMIPTFEDITFAVSDCQVYSTIDLKDAYLQMKVTADSRKLLTIATPLGYYRYRRLPFGLSSAPLIFQKYMDNLLKDVVGVAVYLDDIIIAGKNIVEHDERLDEVLQRLRKSGIKARIDKCTFGARKVDFLGHRIEGNRIKPLPERIKAIQSMRIPCNVAELRTLLGTVAYVDRFIPNVHAECAALYELTKKGKPWEWTEEHTNLVNKIKEYLTTSPMLIPYDGKNKLKVYCDACQDGVGAVLCQDRGDGSYFPVIYVSRSLNEAERRYSQIDREALALVFGTSRLHKYLAGRKFTLVTDHKPLKFIYGEKRGLHKNSNNRLVRWGIILSQYDYVLESVKGTDNPLADVLSRFPQQTSETTHAELSVNLIQDGNHGNLSLSTEEIRSETSKDDTLRKIRRFVETGWPYRINADWQSYSSKRNELSVEDGIVLWASRIVVPKSLRRRVLETIHQGHSGIVAMKELARFYVWWPNMDTEIENTVKACQSCQGTRNQPPCMPLYNYETNEDPWHRLHIDFAGPHNGIYYLIVVCATTKWPEVIPLRCTTAVSVINVLRGIFSRYGVPAEIVSDNGPPFQSAEFGAFLRNNGIKHGRITPYHPRSNGLAERMVQTFKNRVLHQDFKKDDNLKIEQFLMAYRNTPHPATGKPPSVLMLGRRLPTLLDRIKPSRKKTADHYQSNMKERFDTKSRPVNFKTGDHVWFRNKTSKWVPGKIKERKSWTSYTLMSPNGMARGHADQLRSRESKVNDGEGLVDARQEVEKRETDLATDEGESVMTEKPIGVSQAETLRPPYQDDNRRLPRRSTRIRRKPDRYTP